MKLTSLTVLLAALALTTACTQSATDKADAGEQQAPAAPVDSIVARVDYLNGVIRSGQSSIGIDSVTFADNEFCFYYTTPTQLLDDEGKKFLPAMTINHLQLLGDSAFAQAINASTKISAVCIVDGTDSIGYRYTLPQKSVKEKFDAIYPAR